MNELATILTPDYHTETTYLEKATMFGQDLETYRGSLYSGSLTDLDTTHPIGSVSNKINSLRSNNHKFIDFISRTRKTTAILDFGSQSKKFFEGNLETKGEFGDFCREEFSKGEISGGLRTTAQEFVVSCSSGKERLPQTSLLHFK